MKALTDDELWGRIRNLQGQIIYTIDQRRPNPIMNITEDFVEFEGRNSHPNKEYLLWCYRLAVQHGVLTERNLPAEFFQRRIARICMALLAKAVPEQIRAFARGYGPEAACGLSGILVYNKDC